MRVQPAKPVLCSHPRPAVAIGRLAVVGRLAGGYDAGMATQPKKPSPVQQTVTVVCAVTLGTALPQIMRSYGYTGVLWGCLFVHASASNPMPGLRRWPWRNADVVRLFLRGDDNRRDCRQSIGETGLLKDTRPMFRFTIREAL